jgi:gamma-glutamylcyclotransferase (GGCT)/AIG2-like uncharacterized protein YtfP
MPARLFVYGTLRQGQAPPEIASAVAQLQPLGRGVARGRLYNLGAYPGALFASDPDASTIDGEVYAVPNEGVLQALDNYEGFAPDNPEESLFVRKQIEIRMTSTGETTPCWAYEYNQPVEFRQPVEEPAAR